MAGHRFNPQKAGKLIDPKRKELIDPEIIVQELDIEETNHIVDLGAGNGFFTLPLAQKTKENVYAVDIEPQMLELLKVRAQEKQITNISYIVSNLEDIKLESDVAEKGIVAFVTHEIPNLEKALEEFKRIIKPGGKLIILDWEAIEMEMGPPLHERISSEEMLKILKNQGFNYQLSFSKNGVYSIIVKF